MTGWQGVSNAWYNAHADSFAANSLALDPQDDREAFLGALCARGPVLDVGCGAGRDLAAFAQHGLDVTGWEPSQRLASLARAHSQALVVQRSLDDLPGSGPWAGIWAMAVLLHTPRARWGHHLRSMADALLPGGVICVVVKEGDNEGMDAMGRPFTAMPAHDLLTLAQRCAPTMAWSLHTATGPTSAQGTVVWNRLLGTHKGV